MILIRNKTKYFLSSLLLALSCSTIWEISGAGAQRSLFSLITEFIVLFPLMFIYFLGLDKVFIVRTIWLTSYFFLICFLVKSLYQNLVNKKIMFIVFFFGLLILIHVLAMIVVNMALELAAMNIKSTFSLLFGK